MILSKVSRATWSASKVTMLESDEGNAAVAAKDGAGAAFAIAGIVGGALVEVDDAFVEHFGADFVLGNLLMVRGRLFRLTGSLTGACVH